MDVAGAREAAKSYRARESSIESEDRAPRIAHTLTACCRCRQRKTRCDPNLPRCLPCERAGAVCEYFDTQKGKKISRTYVIRLQDRVRALEAELGQYIEEDPRELDTEDIVRPGTLVRLGEDDETPRYLGASSGIAMTRIVMEEAKKYTDSKSIRELVPEVKHRRTPLQSPESATIRKKSYPMISAVPAPTLPSRLVMDKLFEVYSQKAQYFQPALHVPTFAIDLQDVYAGSNDPYKNFIVRMILAISMQRLDTQYAGLADSYYLAAMAYMEAVIRPKDLGTLQCLVLIAQYSLITPTRTAIYYIVGLATRLCQQLGLTDEDKIKQGVALGVVNPIQLDMRRRLFWIVLSMEFGLAQAMGRPNAFANGDNINVKFFETLDDEYITANGILPGPVSEKKTVAIHFFKMRLLQAEIRKKLYQKKRLEPKDEDHPWFAEMEQKMLDWLDNAPEQPTWAKAWFTNRYNTMITLLHRPSPQVSKPSVRSAVMCYDASAYNIMISAKQVETTVVDITWVFILALFMAINTILWTISYTEVRSQHNREEVRALMDIALVVVEKCRERWPGITPAGHLYSTLAKACLRSYDSTDNAHLSSSSLSTTSPSSFTDPNSPEASDHSSNTTTTTSVAHSQKPLQPPKPNPPQFNTVFDQKPEPIQTTFEFSDSPFTPTFRSNSIFASPSSMERRFSYFPPDFPQPQALPNEWLLPITSQLQSQLPSHDLKIPTHPTIPVLTHGTTTSAEPTPTNSLFFQDSTTYAYPPHLFSDQFDVAVERHGSLSQQQQTELMQTLETEGVDHIDSFMSGNGDSYEDYVNFRV